METFMHAVASLFIVSGFMVGALIMYSVFFVKESDGGQGKFHQFFIGLALIGSTSLAVYEIYKKAMILFYLKLFIIDFLTLSAISAFFLVSAWLFFVSKDKRKGIC